MTSLNPTGVFLELTAERLQNFSQFLHHGFSDLTPVHGAVTVNIPERFRSNPILQDDMVLPAAALHRYSRTSADGVLEVYKHRQLGEMTYKQFLKRAMKYKVAADRATEELIWSMPDETECPYAPDIDLPVEFGITRTDICSLKNIISLLDFDHSLFHKGGYNAPRYFVGTPGSMFGMHTESGNTGSILYMHNGGSKILYSVAPKYFDQVKCLIKQKFPDIECQNFDQHMAAFMNPDLLRGCKIPVQKTILTKGTMALIGYKTFHWGFNEGINLAEGVAFAGETWLDVYRTARNCDSKCGVRKDFGLRALFEECAKVFRPELLTLPPENQQRPSQPAGMLSLAPQVYEDWVKTTLAYDKNSAGHILRDDMRGRFNQYAYAKHYDVPESPTSLYLRKHGKPLMEAAVKTFGNHVYAKAQPKKLKGDLKKTRVYDKFLWK